MEKVKREIIAELLQKPISEKALELVEREVGKKYKLATLPTKVKLLKSCSHEEREKLRDTLIKKPVRRISGVCVVTVAPKDESCAWGNCIYCPRTGVTKSYIGTEPVIQRAKKNQYDAFLQVRERLNQYKAMGHLSHKNKIEVIIVGGTFLGLPRGYRESFIKGIFDGLNGSISNSLEEAKERNEHANHRCVSFFVETRPDFCLESHVDEMLRYGITGVEIGAQSIYPAILKLIKRGHSIEDVKVVTKIARNAGLKIGYHLMPNLPGSNFKADLKMFREIFKNSNFKPDYLKIYPTLVVQGTELYEIWKEGKYAPYEIEKLIELLAKAKKYIPPYCRIQHMGRDFPATGIAAGCKKSNLRELVRKRAAELGIRCRCIRCREVGFRIREGIFPEHIQLSRIDYEANDGKEIFLSFEDREKDILLAFLRLRVLKESHRKEISEKTAIIRELKVFGAHVPIEEKPNQLQFQHRGFGRALLREAEKIAAELGKEKIVVTSGVGVREYYRKFGYELEGPYMAKAL